jgi:hypothetical protein
MASRNAERREPVTRGTGNVFADLGFPDAAERQAKRMARERKESAQRLKVFKKARRRALARLRKGWSLQWTPEPSRGRLHERP